MSKQIAQEIRQELKKIGYTSRMVSVSSSSALYDTAVDVRVKDFETVQINKVREIAKKYEEVDRDERSGEILSGGNTYVHVSYDQTALQAEVEKNLDVGKDIYNTIKSDANSNVSYSRAITLIDTGRYEVVYYHDTKTACILKRPEGYKEMTSYCLDTLGYCHISNEFGAANMIVSFGILLGEI